MKKTTKPAAKTVTTKRPRTYKKADLPRTARAYLGKVYSLHMDKENEAVARLIELHEKRIEELQAMRRAEREPDYAPTVTISRDHTEYKKNLEVVLNDHQPKQLTLREKFLAWIGAK
jgi:hypothetical protein